MRSLKREGLNPFFGNQPMWYEYTDENGVTNILHPDELPEDFVHGQIVADELRSVEVEYCLDGYNEFYVQATSLLADHHTGNDVKQCAAEILKLFK